MRLIFFPLALVAATPAVAQDRPADRIEQAGEILSNPMVQSGVAGLVSAFAEAVLDTKLGPLARYTDPSAGLRDTNTLGDVVRRSNPNYRTDLQRDTRRGVAALGQKAKDSVVVAHELEKTVRRLQTLLDATAGAVDSYRQAKP